MIYSGLISLRGNAFDFNICKKQDSHDAAHYIIRGESDSICFISLIIANGNAMYLMQNNTFQSLITKVKAHLNFIF